MKYNLVFLLSFSVMHIAMAGEVALLLPNDPNEADYTANIVSIFARKGVLDTELLKIEFNGANDREILARSLRYAAIKAPIVFLPFGPSTDATCSIMANESGVVFVVVPGNDARQLNPSEAPSCMAKNILFVGALDQKTDVLTNFSNWGV